MAGPFPFANRPDVTHRRLGALALASVAVMALSTPLASAEDDLKDKQKQVHHQVSRAESDLEDSSATAARATAALHRAEASLHTAKVRLHATQAALHEARLRDQKMQDALDEAVHNLRVAQHDLEEGRQKVAHQKDDIAAFVTSVYEQGDPRLLGFAAVAGAGDPGDMTRAMAFNESYGDREDAVLSALENAEQELAAREAQVEARKAQVAASRAAAAANLVDKEALEKKAASETAHVQSLVDERAAIQHQAAKAKAADRAALAHLKAKEDHIAALLKQRAAAEIRKHGGNYADGPGYLSAPASGPITSPFGWRIHPIWHTRMFHNGIDFGVGCGQPLRAPADGVVVARGGGDWDPSGNYMFIDLGVHGGVGLSTSYSHASRYIVGVGQHVKRGQTIGYVGDTGWATGCHLHWTVKENGVDVDPMKWL
ncbi:M23 family metallopeptidase [Nocardioides jiangxiensis]|uniref:Peptidoglycan DD-metalloendopeptidase family protein n=1 Tax=Nocardioides jiangxiensis TaxID=3064524 RepID=A0ABT9B290_9ACTN|nr:M23 family metallopeptidase [Nocardioides sp. WY-20]MDO7868971.1 peptidoglycan DD-metalloendopeptidase family protein [Nocardioides sp. WY-20]